MLENYSWYLVYGCYGSLLEAQLGDIVLRQFLGMDLIMVSFIH
jgi:hypothetical protein